MDKLIETLDPDGIAAGEEGNLRLLRQSTVSQAGVCSRRVMYDLDPDIPFGTGPFRVFGTAYHAGVEAMYRYPDSTNAPLNAVTAAFESEEAQAVNSWDPWAGIGAAMELCGSLVEAYRPHLRIMTPGVSLIGAEVMVYGLMPVDGWAMRGQLDLVVDVSKADRSVSKGFDHLIVDHKTARRKWPRKKESARQANQPSWYTYWWARQWKAKTGEDINVGFAFDIMTHKREFETRFAPVSQATQAAVARKASLVIDLIEQDGPWLPNTESFLCASQWCDHWARCPFGQEMETK